MPKIVIKEPDVADEPVPEDSVDDVGKVTNIFLFYWV